MKISIFLVIVILVETAACVSVPKKSRSLDDDVVDFRSMTRAARDGDIDSVNILLKRGISPNGISPNGIDVIGDYDIIELQNSKVFNQNIQTPFSRPIQAAARTGRIDIVQLLLKHGADPNWCCCECVTALHMAIANGHEAVANLLIENGAEINLPYIAKNGRKFETCLELAKYKKLWTTVKLIESKQA